MKKVLQRPATIVLLLMILLVAGIGVAKSGKSHSAKTAVDCADDCKAQRDKMLKVCDKLPEARRETCRENASKQYDKCVERCQGNTKSSETPSGNPSNNPDPQ